MKNIFTLKYILLLLPCVIFSQVGIGTSTPSSSSILHIVAPNKTIKLPIVNNISTLLGTPSTDIEEGALFFDVSTPLKKCIRFVQNDLSESECLLTKDDIYTASEQSTSLASTISVTTTTYTDLVTPIVVTGHPTKRTATITLDASRDVTVTADGNCSSVDLRLIETNISTSVQTTLYEATSRIIPRFTGETDIFSLSKVVLIQLNQTDDMRYNFQYKRNTGCPTTGTNNIIDADMSVIVY